MVRPSSIVTPRLAAANDGVFSAGWFQSAGVRIVVIIAIAVIVSWVARLAVRRLRRKLERSETHEEELSLRRITTITSTLTNFMLVTVWVIAVLMILDQLNVNLAPLLASAGIVGVALSFGAQTLVRDFLVGFFVILEDQYRVGDSITVTANGGSFSGKVEDLSLRYTSVRGGDGTLYEVGNGNILFVANRSRGTGHITVDVRMPREGSLREMERRLERAVAEMRSEPSIAQLLSDGPTVVGLEPVDGDRVLASISATVWASRRDRTEATLRRELSRRMAAHGEPDGDGGGS
jgi:moderate conductance mechanosensitive channel